MTEHELLEQVKREQLREIFREVLAERDRQAEAERLAQEQSEQAELDRLGRIGRLNLSPRQASDLINTLGVERYNQLPLYGEDQPRDGLGRYRSR